MRRRAHGFSLVEVVVAVAVLTAGVVVILALLPGLIRRQADAGATHVALRLPAAIASELTVLAAGNLPTVGNRLAEMDADTGAALRLVAGRDGSDVRELNDNESPVRDQYFLIELFRFPAGSALAYDPAAAVLPLQARVSWPYRVDAARSPQETPAGDRQSVSFNLALNR